MLRSILAQSQLALAALILLCCHAMGQQNPHGQLPLATAPEPYPFLIRDPVVQADLRVDAEQRKALRALNDELDTILWSMRNKGEERTVEQMREATATARSRVASILNANQLRRLEQIELWVLGVKAFLDDELPAKLRLSDRQREEIRSIVTETQTSLQELTKEVQDGGSRQAAEKKSARLQSDQQRRILAQLGPQQRQQWVELLGRRIDLERLGHVTFRAPDLVDVPDWINTSPITLHQLKGKVVALHFYAFGCINCKRNFPWYKQWHDQYADQGLVVLGIQTPETRQERDFEKVRNAAHENGLEYPILMDTEKQNWDAWGNSMWPSTYLIDKQGRVRYWWYGELDWKDTGGHNLMRARVEELLAEKANR